jgi:hypothetical protein
VLCFAGRKKLVEVQDDLNKPKFYKEYVELLSRPAPGAKNATGN